MGIVFFCRFLRSCHFKTCKNSNEAKFLNSFIYQYEKLISTDVHSNISGRLYQLIGKNSARTKTGSRGNSRGCRVVHPLPLNLFTSPVSYAMSVTPFLSGHPPPPPAKKNPGSTVPLSSSYCISKRACVTGLYKTTIFIIFGKFCTDEHNNYYVRQFLLFLHYIDRPADCFVPKSKTPSCFEIPAQCPFRFSITKDNKNKLATDV